MWKGAMRHKAEQWTKAKLASKWPRHQQLRALAMAPAEHRTQLWVIVGWYADIWEAYNLIGIQPITFIIRTTCERGIMCNISISFMFYSIASILCGILGYILNPRINKFITIFVWNYYLIYIRKLASICYITFLCENNVYFLYKYIWW